MIYYSKNPIVTTIPDVAIGYKVEFEIFVEETLFSGLTVSLGVFQFISTGTVLSQRVDSELDVYLSNRLRNTIPTVTEFEDGPAFTAKLSTRFRVDYRINDGTGFDAWQTGDTHWLLCGGQPWEVFTDSFKTDAPDQVTWLHAGGPALCSRLSPGFLFFLIPVTGEFSFFFTHYSIAGVPTDTAEITMETINNFQIVQIPVILPEDSQADYFKLTVLRETLRSAECDLKVSRNINPSYSMGWKNGAGAWSYCDFDERLVATLDVSQGISESNPGSSYYNADLSAYRVYKTDGRKKFKASTGFMLANDLAILVQDLLLSPNRFLWNESLQKWIPILINSKTVEYKSDGDFIRSAVFEFQTAFENQTAGNL
jgi:hypothetical protein